MPECLHGETHDHIICILNLWAPVNQGIKSSAVSAVLAAHLALSLSLCFVNLSSLCSTGDGLFLSLVFFVADTLVDSSGSSTPSSVSISPFPQPLCSTISER